MGDGLKPTHMNDKASEWIDPATARRLMLEYRQALGVKGGSKISSNIYDYGGYETLDRKTIENWLSSPTHVAHPETLRIALKFMRSRHFQELVPRARDYLEADARLYRRGAALFDLHGTQNLGADECARLNSLIEGWWSGPLSQRDMGTHESSYMQIDLVPGQSFSRLCLHLIAEGVLMASGVVFPMQDPEGNDRFEARIWDRRTLLPGSMTISCAMSSPRSEGLFLYYQIRDQPHRMSYYTFFPADESLVPEAVRATFESWRSDVIPLNPTGQIEA